MNKKKLLGYLNKEQTEIWFDVEVLYQALAKRAKNEHYPLPSKEDIWKQLCDEGLTIKPPMDEGKIQNYTWKERINNISVEVVRIPISKIFPSENTDHPFASFLASLINQTNGE